jgi:hypothetical protein
MGYFAGRSRFPETLRRKTALNTFQFLMRGLLPKETRVLIDGKRVAITGLDGAGGGDCPQHQPVLEHTIYGEAQALKTPHLPVGIFLRPSSTVRENFAAMLRNSTKSRANG